jgi:hypothetical protein
LGWEHFALNKERNMSLKTIVVNRHRVRANARAQAADGGEPTVPVISVRRGRNGRPHYPAFSLYIGAPCHVIYDPSHPLPCGATVWIETDDDVLSKYPDTNVG